MFAPYLARWGLEPDGEPIVTRSGRLLPVRRGETPAMLKIAVEAEERWGGLLMAWWGGEGAARVLAHDEDALLLERAVGTRSLAEMARTGRDDEATGVLCGVVERLHAPRDRPRPDLIPLPRWFEALAPAAACHGGLLVQASATARELFDRPRDVTVLHGDVHHGNVLDFGPCGWLAIDPKRLAGERGFDFVNILRNPDPATALAPGRFARQAGVIAAAAGLERRRLLQWVLAFAGLSAAWHLEDGERPELDVEVAALAAMELSRM